MDVFRSDIASVLIRNETPKNRPLCSLFHSLPYLLSVCSLLGQFSLSLFSPAGFIYGCCIFLIHEVCACGIVLCPDKAMEEAILCQPAKWPSSSLTIFIASLSSRPHSTGHVWAPLLANSVVENDNGWTYPEAISLLYL